MKIKDIVESPDIAIDISDDSMENNFKNHYNFYKKFNMKFIIVNSVKVHYMADSGTIIFMVVDENVETTIFTAKFKKIPNMPTAPVDLSKNLATSGVYRDKTRDETKGLISFLFDYILQSQVATSIISDELMTKNGFNFWKKTLTKNFEKGIIAGIIDVNDNSVIIDDDLNGLIDIIDAAYNSTFNNYRYFIALQ